MSIVSNAQPQYLNIPCCAVCLSNIADTKTFIQFSACDIIIFRVAELRVCSSLHTLNWNRTNERNKNHKWRNLCDFRAKTKKHWVILMSSALFVSEQNTCCFVAISHTSKFRKESFALKLNNAVKHFQKDTNGSELVYSPFNKKKEESKETNESQKSSKTTVLWFIFPIRVCRCIPPFFCDRLLFYANSRLLKRAHRMVFITSWLHLKLQFGYKYVSTERIYYRSIAIH